jgi:hypothetical protein
MKNYLFLVIGILISLGLFSQTVSNDEAVLAGINFYKQKAAAFNRDKSNFEISDEVLVKSQQDNNAFYVLNYRNGGFVLVSADRRTVPVLAYSFEDSFDIDDLAPANRLWIDKYMEQLDMIIENNILPDSKVELMWDNAIDNNFADNRYGKEVDKLVETKWNQNYPYNIFCPEHPQGPGDHVYAGCVATTMAQVMKYWNYPETGRGSAEYFWGDYITVNFEETTYKWDEMTTTINSISRDAIAELIYHCGVSVNMDYNFDGSGASISNSFYALKQNFRYRAGVIEEEMYLYEDYQWKFLLREDLDKAHPIIYRGTDDYGNGHAFVCDGYQDTSYFHFNWGWGGYGDGFYYLDDINPQMDFHWGQGALINLTPNYAEYCNSMVYNQRQWTFDDGSGPNYYFNNQDCDWLISLTDHDVEFIKINFTKFNTLEGDTLYIYEGNSTAGTLIGEYSANDIPTELFVYNDEVYFRFVTNSEGQTNGWELMYNTSVLGVEGDVFDDLTIYPNPANEQLNIVGLIDNSDIVIYDLSGKVLKEIFANSRVSIDISDLASGVYFVRIQSNNITEVLKFVKQ